jgi:dTDP-3-amino-3,4,6-trideoxy-alpha-D-glucose transaminase
VTAAPVTRVGFANLARAVARQRDELDAAVARVLDSGCFVLGAEVRAFEHAFAAVCGVPHAVGVGSGTNAIEVALRAVGVGRGDEVITQANTCVPTVAAIACSGATPVLCDVDLGTATMDVESLDTAISPRTRAVVPVHLYGQCADMEGIMPWAADRGLAIVEDCAQSVGARSRVGLAGTHGELGAFSFYPTKNLAALGDAGAVISSDAELATRARQARQYGEAPPRWSVEEGINTRLDELQAAVLLTRLTHLAEANARRRAIAIRYDAALADSDVAPLARLAGHDHVFHLYVVRAPRRDAFVAELGRRGVDTMVHYPAPIHAHPAYQTLDRRGVSLENAERLAREVVSLPLYPELTDAEVEHVAEAAGAAAGRM